MNKHQQDLRRHAAEQFVQSFDQELLGAFQEDDETSSAPSCPPREPKQPTPKATAAPKPTKPTKPISLSELEDAISDIEQYLQSRKQSVISREEE